MRFPEKGFAMKPVEVAKNIYWVGVKDWNIRDFHGYSTYDGTTYNAFLIMDEKITLIDTVKNEFADELINKISQIIDPKRVDYVISNHTEPDHSGGLPAVMKAVGDSKPLYCSKMGHKNLSMHYPDRWNYQPVEDGGTLKTGKRTLSFIETRMIHWPDSMFTYDVEDQILFSSDGFGQHYAGINMFDDEVGDEIMPHAKKYFANILLLYSPLILKLIQKVKTSGLPIRMIFPDHGILWRKEPMKIINAYVEWCNQAPKRKAVVVYDSMWHSTEKMALAIVESLGEEGVDARLMHLRKWHRSDIMTEVLDAGALIAGSPTLNNNLFPTMGDFLTYLKGLKPKNKVVAAFGSYGWSGEAVKNINSVFEELNLDIIDQGVKSQYVPGEDILNVCRALGKKIAERLPR